MYGISEMYRLSHAFKFIDKLRHDLVFGDLMAGSIANKKIVQELTDYYASIEDYETCQIIVNKWKEIEKN